MADDEPTGSCPTLCLLCGKREPYTLPFCDPCRRRIASALWEVRDLTAVLPAATMPGQTGTVKVSGTREAPLPLRVDPLDLSAPADLRTRRLFARGALGLDDDQVGSLAVATVLQTWAIEWATELEVYAPAGDVDGLVSWLSRHLQWALREHAEAESFAREVLSLLYTLRAQLNVSHKPIFLPDACPNCGQTALRRDPGGGDIVCGNCRRDWPYIPSERAA